MAKKKSKKGSTPVLTGAGDFWSWWWSGGVFQSQQKALDAWYAQHQPDPVGGASRAAGQAVGTAVIQGLAPALVNGARGIADAAWNSGKGHAWEWVVGIAMVFVLIGSARRIGSGGSST